MSEHTPEPITEKQYWEQLETITDRIKQDTEIQEYKNLCDKLNNAWHEGMDNAQWIAAAGIGEYLD